MFKAVVVEEHSLEDWSVGTLEDLGNSSYNTKENSDSFSRQQRNQSFGPHNN